MPEHKTPTRFQSCTPSLSSDVWLVYFISVPSSLRWLVFLPGFGSCFSSSRQSSFVFLNRGMTPAQNEG
ncbi:hypothetical protein LINGRAHAP2_LOCUS10799, partial [Linum grandiflorum]